MAPLGWTQVNIPVQPKGRTSTVGFLFAVAILVGPPVAWMLHWEGVHFKPGHPIHFTVHDWFFAISLSLCLAVVSSALALGFQFLRQRKSWGDHVVIALAIWPAILFMNWFVHSLRSL